MANKAHIRSINIAIFTRACWLAGYDLETVARSCRKSGATEAEVGRAINLFIADDVAMAFVDIIEQGAHLDRRAAS